MNGYEKEKLNTSLLEANGNQEAFDYLSVCLFARFGSAGSSSLCLGFSLVVVHGLLTVPASLVVELGPVGFSSCGFQALEYSLSSCV